MPAARGWPRTADADLRLCAIRELYEETGVLLARRRASPTGAAVSPAAAAFRPWRHNAAEGGGPRADLAALVRRRWVTPPFGPARFDTIFYLAWAPEGQPLSVQAEELAGGAWIRPDLALDEWSGNRALLASPTLYAIRGLAAVGFEVEGGDGPCNWPARPKC
jgi:8-oxo-dGTP pyrophosphatase MutT (NUDIX family)